MGAIFNQYRVHAISIRCKFTNVNNLPFYAGIFFPANTGGQGLPTGATTFQQWREYMTHSGNKVTFLAQSGQDKDSITVKNFINFRKYFGDEEFRSDRNFLGTLGGLLGETAPAVPINWCIGAFNCTNVLAPPPSPIIMELQIKYYTVFSNPDVEVN